VSEEKVPLTAVEAYLQSTKSAQLAKSVMINSKQVTLFKFLPLICGRLQI
jgi:hypothetical protein